MIAYFIPLVTHLLLADIYRWPKKINLDPISPVELCVTPRYDFGKIISEGVDPSESLEHPQNIFQWIYWGFKDPVLQLIFYLFKQNKNRNFKNNDTLKACTLGFWSPPFICLNKTK